MVLWESASVERRKPYMPVEAPTTPVPVARIAAEAARVDREARFPRASIDILAGSGWLALGVPERFGGPGGGPEQIVAAIEQVARACASTGMVYVMHVVAMQTLVAGTDENEP